MSQKTNKCCNCHKPIGTDTGPVFYQPYDATNKYKSMRKPAEWHLTCWNNHLAFEAESRRKAAEQTQAIIDAILKKEETNVQD